MPFYTIPMLQQQRELYNIPRGMERFSEYLKTMLDETGQDVELPIMAMNPMGKDHIIGVLDSLLVIDAEKIVEQAAQEAEQKLAISQDYKIGLVVTDDIKGGWTNRHFIESQRLYGFHKAEQKRGWMIVLFWVSDPPTTAKVKEQVLKTIYRNSYHLNHTPPKTLDEIMQIEGASAIFAGATTPQLNPEDLEYTQEILAPYRNSQNFAEIFACLYGDEAAKKVGYKPLGLSSWAGYALALDEAKR